MNNKPKILAVVPARGGSKGVPGKNLRPLAGLPLIARTLIAARRARGLDRLWVSTDDPAIAAEAERYGVPVPWLRPAELAGDESPLADALLHLLDRLEKDEGYRPDAVLVLQPTSPFRTPATIEHALAAFDGETLVSVTRTHVHPYWSFHLADDGRLEPFMPIGTPPPRQKLPPAYALEGSIFLIATETLRRDKSFYARPPKALVVEADGALDIDTPHEWSLAEGLLLARAPRDADPAFIIAEAGVNHNGDLELARRLVWAAKEAGADAVKFQTFKAEKLVTPTAPKAAYQQANDGAGGQLEMLARLELDEAAHRELMAECGRAGIEFLSTPFDEDSIGLLERLGVRKLKLPSGELTNRSLLERAARTGLPLLVSTGMSELSEVAHAVSWIQAVSSAPLTLLHCVSEYPAPPEQSNLRALDALREAFGLPVGFSDHTPGIEVSCSAVARGARVIEKHLTLDRNMPGPDHKASLEPAAFKDMVEAIRRVEASLGDGVKRPAPCEAANRIVARRSLVAARALPAEHLLAAGDLAAKRPGSGIPPDRAPSVIGRRLKRGLAADEPLTWELLA